MPRFVCDRLDRPLFGAAPRSSRDGGSFRPGPITPDDAPDEGDAGVGEGIAAVLDQGLMRESVTFYAPKLIVSRMQDHIVETADGNLHLLVNLGRRGLTLFTSSDGGATWAASLTVPGVPADASADLRLIPGGEGLLIATTTKERWDADGSDVTLFAYDYVPAGGGGETAGGGGEGGFVLASRSIVVTGADSATTNPTVAIEESGRIVVATSLEGEGEGEGGLTLVLSWSDDGGLTWQSASVSGPESGVESGLDSDLESGEESGFTSSPAGSARALVTAEGTGLLLATADAFTFLTYDAAQDVWSAQTLSETGAVGRYASHFSIAMLGADIHVASVAEDGVLRLFHYDGTSGTWSAPAVPEGVVLNEASNVQISAGADGSLVLIADDHTELGEFPVLRSTDGGATWSEILVLELPDGLRAEPVPFDIPDLPLVRFEAPEAFEDTLAVLVQVSAPLLPGASGLYSFVIDPDTGTAVAGSDDGTALPVLDRDAPFLDPDGGPSVLAADTGFLL